MVSAVFRTPFDHYTRHRIVPLTESVGTAAAPAGDAGSPPQAALPSALAATPPVTRLMLPVHRRSWRLRMVGMIHATHKRPGEISGGMKQRVGIARALAMEPKVLLLDEPFGALDALTRAHLQDELLKIVERMQSTVVMVTHDVDEAALLSDRLVMMTNGPAATIGDIVDVTLARPRDRAALADDIDYMHCRKRVMDFLYTRHTRPDATAARALRSCSRLLSP